ncbi:MAG: stage 0 sporulation family protein [Bacillota bacterium]
MTKVVSVKFKSGGKSYFFDPGKHEVKIGDFVVVETARGNEYGEAVTGIVEIEEDKVISPLKPVVRIATEADTRRQQENKDKEAQALKTCEEKINKHKIDMKLVDVEFTFDGSKILFYFTSEGRVDFRELVKDLAGVFKTRIELRQIGVRDEAKMLGGLGICGQSLCCSTFLNEFHPVSIKMAKEQGLSLNPTKISGNCGRLMCCLKYEQEAYEDLLARVPAMDAIVKTPNGPGTVVGVSLLKEKVKVRLDDDKDATDIRVYMADDLEVVKRPRRKDDSSNIQELKKLE